jgi:hypothetical protein
LPRIRIANTKLNDFRQKHDLGDSNLMSSMRSLFLPDFAQIQNLIPPSCNDDTGSLDCRRTIASINLVQVAAAGSAVLIHGFARVCLLIKLKRCFYAWA